MDGGANTKAFYGTTCLALNVNITPVVVYSDIETQKVLLLKDNKGKSGVYNPNYVKLLRTPLSLFLSYPALPAKIKIKRASLRDFPPPPPLAVNFAPQNGTFYPYFARAFL